MLYNESKPHHPPCPPKKQAHVHEIQGSVEIAEVEKPYYPDGKNDTDGCKKGPCFDYDEDKKDPCFDYDEDKNESHNHCPKNSAHNHRFATVSGEAISLGCNDHYHEVKFRTDFYEEHYHFFVGRTGGAIRVGDRHVHFLVSETTLNDGHRHDFRLATLIEDPIGD